MVYFSASSRRTPAQRVMRRIIGAVAVSLIVFALWQVPYDILREERFRLFGEARTTGVVLEVRKEGAAEANEKFIIDYKYVDQDGFPRKSTASLNRKAWGKYMPGSRIEVIYARSKPDLARVRDEIEPAFQVWLRDMLH